MRWEITEKERMILLLRKLNAELKKVIDGNYIFLIFWQSELALLKC